MTLPCELLGRDICAENAEMVSAMYLYQQESYCEPSTTRWSDVSHRSLPNREDEYGESCDNEPSAGAVASVSSAAGHTLAAESAFVSHCCLADLVTGLCADTAHFSSKS